MADIERTAERLMPLPGTGAIQPDSTSKTEFRKPKVQPSRRGIVPLFHEFAVNDESEIQTV